MSTPESGPEVGTVMKDGTIYAGVSPETGRMLFVMPKDAPLLMNDNVAKGRIAAMNDGQTLGHDDWRLPTLGELKVLFENKAKGGLKGTFNEAAERNKPFTPPRTRTSPSWYRASDQGPGFTTKGLYFNNGEEETLLTIESSSVRYVRDGESPGVVPLPSDPYVTLDITAERQDLLKKMKQRHKLKIKYA